MKKIALIASMSGSMLALSTAASFADYTLNILHINDWHSRIESINKYDSTCSDEDETQGACFGGAARLITAIAQRREALTDDNLLVLNAGDNFQGSLFYTTYKGEAEAEFLNQMGFDAMAVGNHEFDDGEEALVPFLDKVEFPVLSANVKPSAASEVGDRIKPSVVIEVGGERIGIIGAVANDTPELASPGPNIAFEEDVATITAEVERLKADGVNKIIALTHVGYPRDLAAIAKIPDVDVVVGGHSHTLLHNSDDKAAGPYPTMVDNPGGYQVPVVQAGSYSKYLGEFSVTFDDAGVVQSASGDPILLDSSFERDEAVVARIKELAGPIEELVAQEVSETTAPIDGDRTSCRARECEMGNLVADAILDRTRDQGVTIAVQNGGGLRASIDEGTITMGEVLAVLPFQNTLATFELSGADLKASIEAGVSEVEDGAGKFPQVAGLKYSFDPSVPPNEGRVQSIEVMEGDSWVPLEDGKTYTIATNNFVRAGGDGYRLFAENAQNVYDYGPSLEQVVADYLADNRPYTPKLDGRIVDVSAAGAAEEAAEETTAPEPAAEEAAAPEPAAEAPAAEAPAAEETMTSEPAAEDTATEEAAAAPEPAAEAPAAEEPAREETMTSEPAAEEAATEEAAAAPEPAAEAPAESADEPMAGQTHVVVAGDSLWELARTFYNDPAQWSRIAEANPGINPNVLTVGQELAIPAAN